MFPFQGFDLVEEACNVWKAERNYGKGDHKAKGDFLQSLCSWCRAGTLHITGTLPAKDLITRERECNQG
jgi:hypothetical protein